MKKFFSLLIFIFFCFFCIIAWKIFYVSNVEILLKEYPIVNYDAATQKAKITLSKKKPPQWLSTREISKVAIGAIVVSEDWAFYQHNGFDSNQIQNALEEAWKKGKLGRGASTITQQVAKNVFLTSERSLIRKILELILAYRMEKALSKNKIIEIYLNIAELGPGIFGIQRASYYYFGKHPSALNAKEGAFLAMLLPSPKRYSQSFRQKFLSPFANKTIRSILFKMRQAQYINDEELTLLRDSSLPFEIAQTNSTINELHNDEEKAEPSEEPNSDEQNQEDTLEQSAFDHS